MEAVGTGTSAMCRLSACGWWAVELLLCTATHSLEAMGRGTPATHWLTEEFNCPPPLSGVAVHRQELHYPLPPGRCTASLLRGSGLWNCCNALPHCLGAVGSVTPAMHCLTTCEQWEAELLLCSATLTGGSGLWNCCNALPHCLGAVSRGTPSRGLPHCLGARSSETPAHAPPHCSGVVGSGTPTMHRLTACGSYAVEPLLCKATLSGGSGLWNSCNPLPQCLGAVGS